MENNGMPPDRREKMDLEIASLISEIEQTLARPITMEERWIIRLCFLSGDSYGLGEARLLVQDSK